MKELDVKIEQWKKRLLDLSKRNRLINFKETKRSSVSITYPSFEVLYKRIVFDEEALSFPYPLKTIYDENGEENNITIQEGDLKTNKTINEQQKTLKVLRGKAKTYIEEQGINSLYLTFGIIKWKENVTSDVILSSPIVLVPVSLTIQSITDPYRLQLHEDEIVVNPSLVFKFENDFGIILPEFDGNEEEISDYLHKISQLANKNDWSVTSDVHLTLLSFLKINMYKDLKDNKDKIVSNPIFKAISGDKSEISIIPEELNNFNHDRNIRPVDTYQVVDADSSQQDAILLSKKGISFVLQGPPGTGKSQTITNIIAEALADGKKVLFVSEKMAALEVVKKRLTAVGLDDFCLTLHSYKANKKEVLSQLAKTLNMQRISLRDDALYKLSSLEEKRRRLNEYSEELHTKCPPLNISIFEANGRLSKLFTTQDIIFDIPNIESTDTNLLNKYKYLLSEFSKTIGKLTEDYADNPWCGCNVPVVTHELRHNIEVNLNKISLAIKEIISSYESANKNIGSPKMLSMRNLPHLFAAIDFCSESPLFPEKWLSEDFTELKRLAEENHSLLNEYKKDRESLSEKYTPEIFDLSAKIIISTIEEKIIDVKKYLKQESFSSSKDIVLKADYILSECMEIRGVLNSICALSTEIIEMTGIYKHNNFNTINQLKEIIDLILLCPNPHPKWFEQAEIAKLYNSIEIAKSFQMKLRKNLNSVGEQFEREILSIEYESLINKFERNYSKLISVVSAYNKLPDALEMKISHLYDFSNKEVENLKIFRTFLFNGINAAVKVREKLDIDKVGNLQEIVSLGRLLAIIVQNPKPTQVWFDENKDIAVEKVISQIKETHAEIEKNKSKILEKFDKDILDVDYKGILKRFKTEYGSLLKFLKGSYKSDKNTIKGLCREQGIKLSDNDIISALNIVSEIKDKEQWLFDNKSLLSETLGDLYMNHYTDWTLIEKNRENFKSIRMYFGGSKIPEALKKDLVEGNTYWLSEYSSIINEIANNNIPDQIQDIFGSKSSVIENDILLQTINQTIENSEGLINDIDDLSRYLLKDKNLRNVTVNELLSYFNSIKIVDETKKWFVKNSPNFKESIGMHYLLEDTDWDNLENKIRIAERIIEYFKGNRVPQRLISLLIAHDRKMDKFIQLKNHINDIETSNISGRVLSLLSVEEIETMQLNDIESILGVIFEDINTLSDKYVNFKNCSKQEIVYESTMSDLVILERIQKTEETLENNKNDLYNKYQYKFKGIDTDWVEIISSLEFAEKFYLLCKDYAFSNKFIEDVASNKAFATWLKDTLKSLTQMYENISNTFEWYANLFDNYDVIYSQNLYSLLDRIMRSLDNLSLLEEWIDYRSIRQQCREVGLSEFVENVERIGMEPDIIQNTFLKRFYRLWLDAMLPKYPAVYAFRSRSHQSIIKEFNDLDKIQFDISRLRILERLIMKLPNTNFATSSVDEVGILKRELSKQKKIKPLRRLFKEIPNLLTALKPCLMMSPLSVSLYLQADGYNFDTIIFDEASQVCTEDAVGAIMRGKQVIIAGDSKQLPPTNFFAAAVSDGEFDVETDDDEYDDTGAYESILEEATNAIPERTLKWHYRSRHEHLIAFSNAKIYNHELVTFPSNIDQIEHNGVEYIFVENGVYDRGGKKHNINEAKRVAELVFEHFRLHPDRSLGIVTFSEAQQQAVDSAIRQIRLQNSQFEKYFSEDAEQAFFIKNLENVQGDERDTIIFSIGYAKDQSGVMYMNFGPLSKNGGHRRLNVAITRAKFNVKLVGSIHPTDIRIESTNSEGVKMLRQYIEFAIHGPSTLQNELHFSDIVNVESPFEESVYDFLVKNGYQVATQVGCSGYRIDMAVKHPTLSGIFVIGIECDGATYHSARTARERDRLRQTVLEDIGWKIYRIWSTDWIKDPKTEGAKLIEAVKQAIEGFKFDSTSSGSITYTETKAYSENDFIRVECTEDEIDTDKSNPYNFTYYKETDVYEVERVHDDSQYLANAIKHVVKQECPIHYELLCKRVATLFGNQKATVKVRNSIDYVLDKKIKDTIIKKDNFLWHKDVKDIQVKIPEPYGNVRPINYISTEEIAEAMYTIVSKSFGITTNDLIAITSRTFGFNRSGGNISVAMQLACLHLLECGRVKEVDGKIVI
ncbi:Protein of unknown function DUF3320 [Ruminiclostridium papyrosolvens DSM 2782]|uniref:Uncharacterized protein n=1 Tax=Ruminiclostridium papyrosolvens DSM 2782 TaxID=588581 RepID=F1TFA5_9FIRM|nr:DUF3320 domain-containing protein [Ruminiclostridium papyrosolvens]EGD47043.1 Protein of unknown function DUF3320 [Ruminiclostridium papyrosolvens DSM 2782]WES33708.1 DUF3320 domain-containing protein [Ruminiclostridium papyrosolvens DSM 2782]